MSISVKAVAAWVELVVDVPHDTEYDLFDHTADWRSVVFSNGRQAIECQPLNVYHVGNVASLTMRLRQCDYKRLCAVIG